MIEFEPLKRIVEAALLASANPLSIPQLLALFGDQEMPSHDDVARALTELGNDCENRGVELKEVASGFRYQVRGDVHPWVARLWTERQTKYSRALLETLSLIAYRQPITRGEIEQIRGVAVSSNIIKTLEEREWVRVVGYRDVPGKPELFGTTRTFLDYFNLKSLDELPPLAEIRDIEEIDPQLALAPVATPGDGESASEEAAEETAEETENESAEATTNETAEEAVQETAESAVEEENPSHDTAESAASESHPDHQEGDEPASDAEAAPEHSA